MFTPQQLDEISFPRVHFNGYSMDAVDAVLEPLIRDYTALHRENALLKGKMRVLVEQLEEYRSREADLRDSMLTTQKTCDQMLRDTEAKCAQMLRDAGAAVAECERSAGVRIAAAEQRAQEASRAADQRIGDILGQLNTCAQILERLRTDSKVPEAPQPRDNADAVAQEIASNLEAIVGTA